MELRLLWLVDRTVQTHPVFTLTTTRDRKTDALIPGRCADRSKEEAFRTKHTWYPGNVPWTSTKQLTSLQRKAVFIAGINHANAVPTMDQLYDCKTLDSLGRYRIARCAMTYLRSANLQQPRTRCAAIADQQRGVMYPALCASSGLLAHDEPPFCTDTSCPTEELHCCQQLPGAFAEGICQGALLSMGAALFTIKTRARRAHCCHQAARGRAARSGSARRSSASPLVAESQGTQHRAQRPSLACRNADDTSEPSCSSVCTYNTRGATARSTTAACGA